MLKCFIGMMGGLLIVTSCQQQQGQSHSSELNSKDMDWPTYGGNQAGNRYSSLTQINTENVGQLELAWSFETGENNDPDERPMNLQCQPIVVNGILYGTTPQMKVFALHADSGEQIWKFDPFADPAQQPRYHPVRGVMYWADGDDQRILYMAGASLYALNATTGEKIVSFGEQGEVDLHTGLGGEESLGHEVDNYSIRVTTPGVIYQDLLITGSSVSESGSALPGYIRAFNVRTGELAWTFHTIPLPGEFGYETWAKDSYKKLGGANCWAGMTLDEERGMVYAGTGSPSVDFYGGDREGENLFANCVIALNAETGERVWHFQTVHHDLWDRDIPCPPNLVTVRHGGQMVDAVAQATKDGYLFLLDRDSGTPLFEVEEVPVPTSPALPGEKPWPTQPVPTRPAPFSVQELTEDNLTNRTPEAHAYALERFRQSRHGSKYMPPSLQGSLYFGFGGGAEWGGNAADPQGVLYQNANNMLWWLQMQEAEAQDVSATLSPGVSLYNVNCSTCHGAIDKSNPQNPQEQAYPSLAQVDKRLSRAQIGTILESGRGRMPSFQHLSQEDRKAIIGYLFKSETKGEVLTDVHSTKVEAPAEQGAAFPYMPPYLNNGFVQFRDQENYPAIKPPWGTLSAIDLNSGEYKWQVTLGEYPNLSEKGADPTGTENHGGPIVTAGGLLFIAATYDEQLRAFDTSTGEVVWQYKLPAGGFATPITYMIDGIQYIVIAAGGTRYDLPPGGSYLAFALPEKK